MGAPSDFKFTGNHLSLVASNCLPNLDAEVEIWKKSEEVDMCFAKIKSMIRQAKWKAMAIPRDEDLTITRDDVGQLFDDLLKSVELVNDLTTK